MLCNIYIKESSRELRNLSIDSSSPVFFINLSQHIFNRLKAMEKKNELEIYLVQDDPYLKDLSNKWVNGGVQLPEIRIVERIVESPPKIIEKTIEVPIEVEVIKEVEVIREVIKEVEVFRDPVTISEEPTKKDDAPIVTEDAVNQQEPEVFEDGILIDTKVAFEDWKSKNTKSQKQGDTPESKFEEVEKVVEVVNQVVDLDLPKQVIDPLGEVDDTMPILLDETSEDDKGELSPDLVRPKKRGRKKKEPVEVIEEVVVELTEDELKQYQDSEVEV